MKFSIITVCRDAGHCLEKTIQSVAMQSYTDWEYLIIDGQSGDNTRHVVQPYMEQGVVHAFVSEPDNGVYDAMNKGLDRAAGTYIYFLNAGDCLLDSAVLEDVATQLSQNPDCDLFYGNVDVISQNEKSRSSVIYPVPSKLFNHLMVDWICHQAMVIKTSLFHQIGQFDTRFQIAADYDWLLRALGQNVNAHHMKRAIAIYPLGGLSDSRQIESLAEMFAIQNQYPAYQTLDALQQRVQKLQNVILDRTGQVQSKQQRLQQQRDKNQTLRAELSEKVKTMESWQSQWAASQVLLEQTAAELHDFRHSIFWKLRLLWLRLKDLVGLPGRN